ncbi:hypothetical protein BJ912DRAFT_969213 [Pholiota molesta]|nr:hypothetical protein BJ912DRAFT_969213 [Pholiota molesta]
MSELSAETRRGEKPFDVVAGLQMLVTQGLLPRMTALGLYLLKGWMYDENSKRVLQGRLLADFWVSLRNECPRLRALTLRNVGHVYGATWLAGPVIDEINSLPGLSTLRLEWKGDPLEVKDNLKILNNLPRLASSLHTLSLNGKLHEATLLFSLDFPHLRWLRLHPSNSFQDTEMVEGFFRRHPHLESLSLEGFGHPWFSENIEVGFLPNLKHLKAAFDHIRALIPILPQLVSLRFTEDYRRQVPHFLHAALRNGLPRLRSLEIDHGIIDVGLDNSERTSGHMHPIARGAPNLEELALHGVDLTSAASVRTLERILSQLMKVERFYYRGVSRDWKNVTPPFVLARPALLSEFLSSVEGLARVCARLESVTSINGKSLPYVSGVIERGSLGDVTAVRLVDGVGLVIPADENDPFPCNT